MAGVAITCTDLGYVTGERSKDRTDEKFAVGGTDLGIMWDTGGGEVAVLFGDTWCPRTPEGGAGGEDWRHQVLGFSTSWPLDDGLVFDRFTTDRDGHACQIIPDTSSAADRFPEEVTTIPTGGCALAGRQYVTYMSVQRWGDPGTWTTNYAGFAYSDDGGATWVKDENAWWPNTPSYDQKFQVTTLVPAGDGYLYLFGTRNGRRGPVFLARTPQDAVLDLDSHEQWTGWGWARDQHRAVPIVDGEVSETSVYWHWPSERWLMMHLIDRERRIVLRSAPSLVGPWSPPETCTAEGQFVTLYGGFLHPWSMTEADPCAIVTQWDRYNTRLMRVNLSESGLLMA